MRTCLSAVLHSYTCNAQRSAYEQGLAKARLMLCYHSQLSVLQWYLDVVVPEFPK
jgi:hypothetical protein